MKEKGDLEKASLVRPQPLNCCYTLWIVFSFALNLLFSVPFLVLAWKIVMPYEDEPDWAGEIFGLLIFAFFIMTPAVYTAANGYGLLLVWKQMHGELERHENGIVLRVINVLLWLFMALEVMFGSLFFIALFMPNIGAKGFEFIVAFAHLFTGVHLVWQYPDQFMPSILLIK